MNGPWILAEQYGGKIETVSFELLTRALELKNGEVTALIIGPALKEDELLKLIERGASRVIACENSNLTHFLIEPYCACFQEIVKRYQPQIILAGATAYGRVMMPYAAMKLHTGLTADCTELKIEPDTGLLLQTRPAIGGNIMATIKCPEFRPQMATLRPHSTLPAPLQPGRKGEVIRIAMDNPAASRMKVIEFKAHKDALNLNDAKRVIVVGKGIKKAENLSMIFELAELLGAAVGATREVIDRGWLDYRYQIGLSGKTISPEFYLGIGVSGAIQHLAGMQNAGNIMAVNQDRNAQIFKVADFGMVGNLFEIIPELIRQLKNGVQSWLNTTK